MDIPDDYIIEFPWRAYNKIFNEYYRDENLQTTEVVESNNAVLNRSWGKDYFTSALPWQQEEQHQHFQYLEQHKPFGTVDYLVLLLLVVRLGFQVPLEI